MIAIVDYGCNYYLEFTVSKECCKVYNGKNMLINLIIN